MPKWLKILTYIVIPLIIFGLILAETEAGRRTRSGYKRKVKRYYYRVSRKPTPTVKLNVPFFRQEHALSCEFAALRMALAAKGKGVSEAQLIRQVRVEPMWGNPNRGFVGNINGRMMRSGYGVYWGPISLVAARYRPAQVFSGESFTTLAGEIRYGNPVIVWGCVGSCRRRNWTAPDGTRVRGVTGEHARVAFGYSGPVYNPTGFYLMDPIYGEVYMSAKKMRSNWGSLGNSGVIIR